MNKKTARLRRARKTRAKIADQQAVRLCIYRSNSHIYAQIIDASGSRVLAQASSVEADVRSEFKHGNNTASATAVGKRIAEKAKAAGIGEVAFDRSGFQYHGRVKALADAARESGLQF